MPLIADVTTRFDIFKNIELNFILFLERNFSAAPYHERQVGNNCRIHALNTLFGRPVIDVPRLKEWSVLFDEQYGHQVTEQFDYIQSDSLMLVSFILEARCHYVTHYIPLGTLDAALNTDFKGKPLDAIMDPYIPALLCFNPFHIWTVRRHQGRWYVIDSLLARPLMVQSPRDGVRGSNNGVILIFRPRLAASTLLPLYQRRICTYLRKERLNSTEQLKAWVARVKKTKELGDLETALCCFYRVFRAAPVEVPPEQKQHLVDCSKALMSKYVVTVSTNVASIIVPLIEYAVHFIAA
jgi:hypothetical protein